MLPAADVIRDFRRFIIHHSKTYRLSHKSPALQGTGVTVIECCCRTGLVAKLRPVVWVLRSTQTARSGGRSPGAITPSAINLA